MADQPNILLMISHDLGRHIGPYGYASECCPRLDRLATESVRLTNHFVTSPGCSPSRASLVTGRYPHSNGQFGLAHLGWELNRDEILLPALLREAGYRTALFGIWHLVDWTLGSFDDLSPDVSARDSSPEGPAQIASRRAADWLRGRGRSAQPFYLHVGFWETHRPFQDDFEPAAAGDPDSIAVPGFLGDTPECRRELALLHQSVARVDRGVGEILDALDSTGLSDDTLVVFTSDHGLAFPRAKGTLYDPGIGVAFLARWPNRIDPASRLESLTSNVDVAPTILEAAGTPIPQRIQGRSLPSLWGDRSAATREAVFAEKTYHEHYDPIRAVRTSRFKYIRNFADRPKLVLPSDVYNSPTRRSMADDEAIWSHRAAEELYDLASDPMERENLAGRPERQAELESLRSRLDQWMAETGDPLRTGPIPRPAIR